MAGARVQPEDIQVGGVLAGRFRVLERLGSGSTAVVYKVQDLLVNDVVALKVLRPLGAEDPNIIARFKRELATARKLSHPNVVTLYDLGTYEGLYYISMEYVEGTSLAERLAQSGPLSLTDFLPLCDEFCKALTWIHSRNFVHRDIKPSNVMYTSTGVLKLMDLGIAKELAADQLHNTRTGTPGYASPEQEAGDQLGPASDIYSTGAMFFELLTGSRPPGRGESSYPEAIRHAAPDLPGIIAKCMQRLPANRFRTVDELYQATTKMRRDYSTVSSSRATASIEDKMTDEPGNVKELIPLFLQTVKRVIDIHTAGRYHLELAPRNILINSAGGVEIESYDVPRSQTSTIGPSQVKYLAPELFADVHDSGSHSCAAQDTYVMGFLFYEMVCGRREFNREFPNAIEGDRFWLTWHGDPRKTLQPLGEIVPKCPKALSTLLQQMTTKDRAGRPASLEQVADALLQLHLSTEDTAPILTPTGKPPVESTPSAPPPPTPDANWAPNPSPNASPNPSPFPHAYPITQVPTDTSSGGKSWLALLGKVAAILLSLAVLVAGAVYVAHERNRPPASFRLEANSLVVLDPHGSELWRKKLDSPVDPDPHAADEVGAPSTRAWFGDLDGDGHTETLFLYSPKDAKHLSSLICLSDRGEERWRFVPGRTVSSRKRAFPPPYRIAEFLVAPVGPKRTPAVIVSSVHFQDYPTQVVLLTPQGEISGEYWHSGKLNRIVTADLDRDGVHEIYLGGVSAARNTATLVALTPDGFTGASKEGSADFQLDSLPQARERGRVFFPRSCMNQKHESSNRVSALRAEKDFISVSVLELLTGPKPVLTYRLDRDLGLVELTLSPQLQQTHKQMEKTGEIDHPFTAAEEAALRAIVVVRP